MRFISKLPQWKGRALAGGVLLGLALLAAGGLHVRAQQRGQNQTSMPSRVPGGVDIDPLDMPPIYTEEPIDPAEQRRLAALNADRQKAMVADTNRLVKMATDLNAQINSQQKTQLTPEQLRQLAEIEKLAHSIRDKMSTTVSSPSPMMGSPMILPPSMR